jgi:hypothetical protein
MSQRSAMAAAAVEWCDSANAAVCPVNIVTALFSLGLVKRPTLTDEERTALRGMLPTIMYEPYRKAIESILARLG